MSLHLNFLLKAVEKLHSALILSEPLAAAMPAGKFNMSATGAGGKRSNESMLPVSFKVPRANELAFELGPKPSPVARDHHLPATAPVTVCMYKVTDQAGDVWEQFDGQNVALWQVQIDHPVRTRSVTFNMRDGFNDYLRAAHCSDDQLPKTVQDLATRAGIRLVITDSKDPEDIGFIHWRVAFYAWTL